jgi:bifunctional UDP-N-acetylglucosamine pyrophosphorylase/glucosamine-1-phosphate N-acetyltransferase
MAHALAIVLAAGKGTRMKSELPKVLVPVLGRPMVEYVLDTLEQAGVQQTVVVIGYRAELVRETLAHRPSLLYAEQKEQLGTGHAVMMCREQLAAHDGPVVILAGDSPMIEARSIKELLAAYERDRPACILGTAHKANPTGLGRVVRSADGQFQGIVEEKDATEEQRQITEVNLSCYLFDSKKLLAALDQVRNDNKQQEYYLTDCPGILLAQGENVQALPILTDRETLSINNMEELAIVEAALRA